MSDRLQGQGTLESKQGPHGADSNEGPAKERRHIGRWLPLEEEWHGEWRRGLYREQEDTTACDTGNAGLPDTAPLFHSQQWEVQQLVLPLEEKFQYVPGGSMSGKSAEGVSWVRVEYVSAFYYGYVCASYPVLPLGQNAAFRCPLSECRDGL